MTLILVLLVGLSFGALIRELWLDANLPDEEIDPVVWRNFKKKYEGK